MKRWIVGSLFAMMLTVGANPAAAVPDEYDDTQSHPLRVAGYLAYPIGFTAEWLIFRPFHWVVSQPYLDQFFGHKPHGETRAY